MPDDSRRPAPRCLPLLWVACLALTLQGCSRSTPLEHAPTRTAPESWYTLTALDDGSGWHVRASLGPRVSGRALCAPALGTRRGESLEWLGARADGEAAAVAWDEAGCFVAPVFTDTLELEYRARIEPEATPGWRALSLSPHAEPGGGVFFPGESLFVEVRDAHLARLVDARIEVELPAGYGLASTLAEQPSGTLEASDTESLLRSVLWIEPALTLEPAEARPGGLRVAISSALAGDPTLWQRAACVAEQLDGWVVPEATREAGTVLVLEARWDRAAISGFTRAGGAVLQVGAAASTQETAAFDGLLAHELFHRYNGESLTWSEADFEATTWFREGATSYVALVTLAQAGLVDSQGFADLLAVHASSYVTSPARSLADERQTPSAAAERLSYDRGVLLSLALDLMLRDVSQGQRSLQGFFRSLSQSADWSMAQSNATLQAALEDYAGVGLDPFFDRYVTRRDAIPVDALLRHAGYIVMPITRQVADVGMRLEYDVDNAWLRVVEVASDGPAARVGIAVGDVVHSLPTTRLGVLEPPDEPLEFEVQAGESGTRRFVRVQPGRRTVTTVALSPSPDEDALWRVLTRGPSGMAAACASLAR